MRLMVNTYFCRTDCGYFRVVGNLFNKMHRFVPILRGVIRHRSMSTGHAPIEPQNYSPTFTNMSSHQSAAASDHRSISSDVVDVNGTNIHYEETGAGKHAVLLLPGALGSTRTDFQPQLENMNKDIFRLIAWDPPGYGKSYPPERDWTSKFLHNDAQIAAKLMEKLNISKYSLLGWSDGGITAMILASMYPERIRKLVVWGANAYITEAESQSYQLIRDIDNWSERMRKPFLELYGEPYFRKAWAGWVDAFVKIYFTDNKGDICRDDLPKITSPALIIHGQKDPMVGQFHADFLHNNIQGSRLLNMPEGKHNLHLRYFKEFNSIVESFLLEL